jgi:hypothetical protein
MRLHLVALLVDDHDEAIAHCVADLGFSLAEDTQVGIATRATSSASVRVRVVEAQEAVIEVAHRVPA